LGRSARARTAAQRKSWKKVIFFSFPSALLFTPWMYVRVSVTSKSCSKNIVASERVLIR
jgi:hypothetical protein